MLEWWSDISDFVSESGPNPGGRQVDTVKVRGNGADEDTMKLSELLWSLSPHGPGMIRLDPATVPSNNSGMECTLY